MDNVQSYKIQYFQWASSWNPINNQENVVRGFQSDWDLYFNFFSTDATAAAQ